MANNISCDTTIEKAMENLCLGDDDAKIAVRIKNSASKLYLTSEMMSNGLVSQQVYLTDETQLWTLIPVDGVANYYKIKNMRTTGIMTGSTGTDNGTSISVSQDRNGMNQQWTFVEPRYGSYVIKNRMNGLVLDIPKGTTDVGVGVQEYSQKKTMRTKDFH